MSPQIRMPLRTRLQRVARLFNRITAMNQMARRLGHEVVPFQYRQSLIQELDGLYRETLFSGLLAPDPARLKLLGELIGTTASEALFIVAYLAKSLDAGGDVCEFGVAQGATSALLAHELKPTDRKLWLFDSFEGLPRPHAKDELKDDIFGLGSIEAYEGTMVFGVAELKTRIDRVGFPAARALIVPGFIEDVVADRGVETPDRVCFAYVDFDFYSGIRTALEFLDERLPVGAHVIVDDYDFFSTGAKTAVDEFVVARSDRYTLSLPIPSAGRFCILERTA